MTENVKFEPYYGKLISNYLYGDCIEMLVKTDDYENNDGTPVWIPLDKIASGTAAVYPIKGKLPNGGVGQWKLEEVIAFRIKSEGSGVKEFHENFQRALERAEEMKLVVIDV